MIFKKNDLVWVRTRELSPSIDEPKILVRSARWSNYPYSVMHEGKKILLQSSEVFQITYPLQDD